MKIRAHILILVIASILPILGFAAIMMWSSWRREETTVQDGLLKGVRAMSLALDRQLDGDIRSLQVLADSPALRSGDLQAFYIQAVRILSLQKTWFNIILSSPDSGRQVINLRYPFGAELHETAFDSKTLTAVADSGRPYITPLAKGKSSQLYRIGVMIPVTSGRQAYLLVATMDQSTWLELLSSYPVPADSTLTLVDQDGIIIARTLNNNDWVGKPPSASLLQHIRASSEGSTVTTGLEGQHFYSAYIRSPLSGWTVAIGIPKDAVQRALWHSSALLFFGGIYVVGLASILALLFGSRIARGVSGLAEYAHNLENFTEEKTKPSAKIAEVDYVAATFANAVGKLQQRESELRISEERFRSLINATTSIVWAMDNEGRCVSSQSSWESYTGQEWDEYRDFGWSSAIHPDDRKKIAKLWFRARATASRYHAAGRLWHASSQTYRHFETTAVPVHNSEGDIREWIGICVDVEDRKRAEAALLESEARFRTLADSSPAPLWVTDGSGNLAFVNAAYCEFFGVKADSASELTWKALIHPEDAEKYLSDFYEALKEQKFFRAKARFRRQSNQWSWIDTLALPRFAEDGTFLGHVGSSHDITDSKSLEEQLRTAARHKDQFLAMLGHELRNPLGVASSCIQLQKMKGPLALELQESQEIIHRQIEHMSKLVDDLLEVGRISRGHLILNKEICDFNATVRETAEDYRAELEAAGLRLTVSLPCEPVWVSGDRTRLAQSTGNLLHNALKFTESGGRVTVKLISKVDERVSLLSIRDSGIGIQHDMVDRVFDSFSQAEQSLDRSKGGLGLGLYLVRQVTELHGGKAWASSAGLGDGSEFFIELPLERAPATCTHVVKSPKSWSPQRILVIDDNRLSVRALQLFLKRKGHTVEIAHDGREGLDVARRFKPKVVLCDIGLPEIDGYTVAHEMRHDSALQAVYLIAVSGYGQDEDQLRARKAGFDDYFIKPINLEQIEESLLTGLAERAV